MADEPTLSPEDERFVTAGEFALGVLEGSDLAQAQRAVLSDPDFAAAVEWWGARLGAMAEEAGEFLPSEAIWQAIERRLDGIGGAEAPTIAARHDPAVQRPAGWSIALAVGGAGLAAAALALFLATPQPQDLAPPPPIDQPAGSQLIAQLSDDAGDLRLAGRIDQTNGRLALTVAGFQPGAQQSPVLWVIPEGGAPVALGEIPASGEFGRDLDREEQALLTDGASLAVTIEDVDGEPYDTPTAPILLVGALDRV